MDSRMKLLIFSISLSFVMGVISSFFINDGELKARKIDMISIFTNYAISKNYEVMDVKIYKENKMAYVWTDQGEVVLRINEKGKVEVVAQ